MAQTFLVEIQCYLDGLSSTSNNIGTGLKTWAITSGSPIPTLGMKLRVQKASDSTIYNEGTVMTVSSTSVTINIKTTNGSGTGITAWRFSNGTLYYSTQEFLKTSAPNQYQVAIATGGAVQGSFSIFGDGKTFGAAAINTGFIKLVNVNGDRDRLRKYAFNGYPVTVRLGDNTQEYSTFTTLVTGTVQQPVVSKQDILFRLRDRVQELDKPINPTKYLGNNTLPDGVQGVTTDLKGRNKPLLRGYAWNFSPPLVNTSKMVYQLSCKQINGIDWVKDGGVSLTVGTNRASLALLLSNTPTSNTFDYYLGSGSDGAYIRVGSNPVQAITVAAYQGANAAARTFAQIAKRVLNEDAGYSLSDISSTDITALDILSPFQCGCWTDASQMSVKNFLDSLSPSALGWYTNDLTGTWRLGKITVPSGTPIRTFKNFDDNVVAKATDSNIVDIELVATNDAVRGLPVARVSTQWQKNYLTQDTSSLNGDQTNPGTDPVGGLTVREILKKQYSTASYPTTGQDSDINRKWSIPQELTFTTLLKNQSQASTVAQQYFNIYSKLRDRFKLVVNLNQDNISSTQLGGIIKVQTTRYGLQDGKLFMVLGSEPNPQNRTITLDIWGAQA